jgi:hypothetical protein
MHFCQVSNRYFCEELLCLFGQHIQIVAKFITLDLEKAAETALTVTFAQYTILGYFFHFTLYIWQNTCLSEVSFIVTNNIFSLRTITRTEERVDRK